MAGERRRAFTLIEILVAMAIIALIMTMVYGSYAATSRSVEVCTSRMACSERAQLVMRLMARQIRCAYMPPPGPGSASAPTPDGYGGTRPAVASAYDVPDASSPAFAGDAGEPRGEILCFVTTGGFGLGPDKAAGLSRVRYRYDRSSGTLSVCCEPSLHRRGHHRDSSPWQPIADGVTDIHLEFHDGRQWQPTWNSRQAGRLPQAVRLALTIVDENGRTHDYRTAVPVACRTAVPDQQKMPAGKP